MFNLKDPLFRKILIFLELYESDGPYLMGPDYVNGKWITPVPSFGELPLEEYDDPESRIKQLINGLKEIHAGDCVKMPASCWKCYSEELIFKAAWITWKIKTDPEFYIFQVTSPA